MSIFFVGEIGFIGLIAPHIARLLVGEDHTFFLPISIVTSIVGIPLFITLILSRQSRL
ncbi:permease protein of ABC transporter (fragment) [Moritella yayanosii]|uniref:Permease protein of ABC transporter n=1 Tax=Moritella yayanosii TaxID=69539 RepID=A0A330LP12_9GAMM